MTNRMVFLEFAAALCVTSIHSQTHPIEPQRVILSLNGGGSSGGFLVAVSSDTLVVITEEGKKWFSYADLNSAIMRGKRKQGHGVGYGAILGTYASILLISTGFQREGDEFFLANGWASSTLGMLVSALPGMLVGGGIGYLADHGSQEEDVVLDFTSIPGRRNAWERISKNGLTDGSSRFHFSLYGGPVSGRATKRNLTQPSSNEPSTFNWLRRIQVTYSALPELDLGLAVIWFGEPRQFDFWYSYSGNDSESGNSNENFDALGYFLTGHFRPFQGSLSRSWNVLLGGGVGLGHIDYQNNYAWYEYSYDPITFQSTFSTVSGGQTVSVNPFCGFVTGEIDYHLYPGLSIGFSIEHVFGPKRNLKGFPLGHFPPRTVTFGNTCAGFVIGLHL